MKTLLRISGSTDSKEHRVSGCVVSKYADLSRDSELRRPEVSRKEVLHKPLQSLLYPKVIISALSSFTLCSLNSSQVTGKDRQIQTP